MRRLTGPRRTCAGRAALAGEPLARPPRRPRRPGRLDQRDRAATEAAARPCGHRARPPRRPPRRRRRAAAVEIWKSSRSDAWPAVSIGPIVRGSASPRRRRTTSSTRAFSVTMCRARRSSTSSSRVPSARRPGRRRRRPRAAGRPRGGRPPPRTPAGGRRSRRRRGRVRRPESTTSSASPAAARSRGTCSLTRSRVSRNSACPAVQSSDADWSRIPVGAPTKSFSAPARQLDQVLRAQLGGDEVAQRQRHRAGERGRRRQAGTHRDVGVDQDAHAAGQPLAQAVTTTRPGIPPSRPGGPGAQVGQVEFHDRRRHPAARRTRPGRRSRRPTAARVVCGSATGSTKPPL